MTQQEFKAWFDGFSEGVKDAPTEKQWERIKKRVSEIDGVAVTERIFIDRYLPTYAPVIPYYRPSPYTPVWLTTNTNGGGNVAFSSTNAMNYIGTYEASL